MARISTCAAALAAAMTSVTPGCAHGPPALLMEIQRAVMAEAVYVADAPGQDIWQASTEGDCEDFALEMRRRLATSGIPADRMTILVLWERRFRTWHAVLLVRTSTGAWVLDSLEQHPRRWDGLGIEWEVAPRARRLIAIDGRPVETSAWRR